MTLFSSARSRLAALPAVMRRYTLLCFAVGLLAGCGGLFAGQPPVSQPYAADAFVDSAGLNVRMSYPDWPTSTTWDNPDPQQNIRHLIADLGVRHLRDRIPHPELQAGISYVNPRLAQLYLDHGLKFIVGVDNRREGQLNPRQTPAFVDWYASGQITAEDGQQVRVRDMIEAVEGPNEYDRHHKPDEREPGWARNLNAYQKQTSFRFL